MVPPPETDPVRLCFVCLGNICRSPTAEGVMAELVAEAGLSHRIEVDSAGTGSWHVGQPADSRAVATARRRGVHLTGTARQFHPGDFYRFDLVLAMDSRNLADLHDLAPDGHEREKVRLLLSFDPAGSPLELDVPDPYYGEGDGFTVVYDLVEAACRGLLAHVRTAYLGLAHEDA
jgi:protein-tyrosine phosphatase